MHRWFFANEREQCAPKSKSDESQANHIEVVEDKPKEIIYTDWTFCVIVKNELQGNEHVAVTGNCEELGNWKPENVKLLEPQECDPCEKGNECNIYKTIIRIPRNIDIKYRYCIIGMNSSNEIIIRYWETWLWPRLIATCHNMLKKCEQFGYIGEHYKVDRGWATTETFIHFKLFNAPFIWLKQKPRLLYVHIQPMYEAEAKECGQRTVDNIRLTTISTLAHNSTISHDQNTHIAYTEVSNLTNASKLQFQPKMGGARCGPHDLQLFHCTVGLPHETLYRIDLYTFAHKDAYDEPPYHYGYGFIAPEQLANSEGQVRIKITCASTHRPLIEMNITYLIIRPVAAITCDLSISYARFWRRDHPSLYVGHRGTGPTYRFNNDVYRENTLFGFRQAALHRADCVEFDVQLTKDAQVVVYHDQYLKFAQCTTTGLEKLLSNYDVFVFLHEQLSRQKLLSMGGIKRDDYLIVPIEAFRYDELRMAHALQFAQNMGCNISCDQLLADQQPFPLLKDVLTPAMSKLPDKLAFNIELKWPQLDQNRRWFNCGFKPKFDRNFFVDTILEVVFKCAGKRRIIFSSFDADICAMLRFKQNLYPVSILIQNPESPIQYLDKRVNVLENAAYLAHILELFGMYFHTNIIQTQPLILGLIRDLRMQVMTWGEPNNVLAIREKLNRYGVASITFDRINQKEQIGECLSGNICCIDSMGTREFILNLEEAERKAKCPKF